MITVDVTNADIESGFRESPDRCPVALALRRELAENVKICVFGDNIKLVAPHFDATKTWEDRLSLPEEAVWFIKGFERTETGKPFSFELDVPKEFLPAA